MEDIFGVMKEEEKDIESQEDVGIDPKDEGSGGNRVSEIAKRLEELNDEQLEEVDALILQFAWPWKGLDGSDWDDGVDVNVEWTVGEGADKEGEEDEDEEELDMWSFTAFIS